MGIFTLKNYGQAINCSISVLFPESIRILTNSIANKELIIDNNDSNLDKKPSDYYDYQLNKNQTDDHLDSNNTIQESVSIIEINFFFILKRIKINFIFFLKRIALIKLEVIILNLKVVMV